MVCFRAVEPRRRGRIVNPRMVRAGVIYNFVLNDLDAGAMRSLNQLAQLSRAYRSVPRRVKVLRVVTVEAGARLAVFEFNLVRMIVIVIPRRKPDGGDSQVA